jgi:hypothetical protein
VLAAADELAPPPVDELMAKFGDQAGLASIFGL